jgi:hypothetical protein
MIIPALFFALPPEKRPLLLDLVYYPRGEKQSIPSVKPAIIEPNRLPAEWKIGDPF